MDDIAMTSPEPVSRQEGIALWRQIATRLQHEIGTGIYPPGGRLPTEAELSQQFRVNRHTVRRALEELSRGGLVRVEQGRGSFVAEDVLEYAVEARTRFSEWIRRHNKEPSGRRVAAQGDRRRSRMSLPGSASEPAAASCCWSGWASPTTGRSACRSTISPPPRLRGVLDALRAAPTITEALKAVGVSDYLRQLTRVTARLPNAEEAELLRMPRNRPLLVTENVNVDRAGTVVEFGISRYPTPRVQIVFEP